MLNSVRRNVVAYLALFTALGGTSYAATQLPANSVGTSQLQRGAVTYSKVRRHSLTARVFAPGTLAQPIHTTVVTTPLEPPAEPIPSPTGTSNTVMAHCGADQKVVGGGYLIGPQPSGSPPGTETVSESEPLSSGDGWEVTFVITQSGAYPTGTVSAVCAS